MASSGVNDSRNQCGVVELLIFSAAIISGTACSICSKTMMDLSGIGLQGDVESFSKPIFQTFGMFVGMTFGLFMHWAVLFFEIEFPGYDHGPPPSAAVMPGVAANAKYHSIPNEKDPLIDTRNAKALAQFAPPPKRTPTWMYFFLAIPAIFDLGATVLCMMGLRFLDVSIYQLLRGSGIIFVALMKQHVLGDRLYTFQWIGVLYNVISVFMVGGTAILNSSENKNNEPGEAFFGVLLVMCGAFVQALQFVFEEKVMTMDESAAAPLLLIGMEGLWGTVLCLIVIYPIAYYLPGDDHGSYEDPWNTWHMIVSTPVIQIAFVIYFFSIFAYNLFAVLVTFMLSSIWHAILDNFRPITVWLTDLAIFYIITHGDFGENWTRWSFIQVAGMGVLLFGTAVYNAPNAGSVKLEGQWYVFGLNMGHEYQEIELERQEAEIDAEWQAKAEAFKMRRPSSLAERSPHISVHTQALRGLASPKI